MKTVFSIVLSVVLFFSAFTRAAEPERRTPREGSYFYLGLGLGGIASTMEMIAPDLAAHIGWVATEDLLVGYELFVWFMPAASIEAKHCFMARYYPSESFDGYYLEGGVGVVTNSSIDWGDGSESDRAFFTRAATGYDFVIGTHTQLGVGLKYHTLFYHAEPEHEFDFVVEINWFLP